ncbi:MAG TPA: NADP-dependent oxidoreductase [Longimicrobiales bacterium]|nr:NADP-dependent oxidoreductase [Longimicrobiales bacterium]
MKSREVQLRNRPPAMPSPDDFQIVETEVGDPAEGEVLVRNLYLSVDPYMRGRMRDRKSYVPPYGLGETMTGGAVGRVVASRAEGVSEGDHVLSNFGWREAFRAPGERVQPLGDLAASPSAYLGIMGMPGMTAYTGLLAAAGLKDGETVFVSGAAGAVGSVVGQIAKVKACRVVGSAGSAEKVRWLTEELGFDHAFDYRDADLRAELKKRVPDGLDVYFDNVGGDHLQAALSCMREFGRIALCGAISMYNDTEPTPGPTNLPRAIGLGLNIRGFLVRHYSHMRDDFLRDVGKWLSDGSITYRETVYEGIESAPEAFIGLFTGANLGKMVVRVEEA